MYAAAPGATSKKNPGRLGKERTNPSAPLKSEARRFTAIRNGAVEYLWLSSSRDPLPRKPGLRTSISEFGRFAFDARKRLFSSRPSPLSENQRNKCETASALPERTDPREAILLSLKLYCNFTTCL